MAGSVARSGSAGASPSPAGSQKPGGEEGSVVRSKERGREGQRSRGEELKGGGICFEVATGFPSEGLCGWVRSEFEGIDQRLVEERGAGKRGGGGDEECGQLVKMGLLYPYLTEKELEVMAFDHKFVALLPTRPYIPPFGNSFPQTTAFHARACRLPLTSGVQTLVIRSIHNRHALSESVFYLAGREDPFPTPKDTRGIPP